MRVSFDADMKKGSLNWSMDEVNARIAKNPQLRLDTEQPQELARKPVQPLLPEKGIRTAEKPPRAKKMTKTEAEFKRILEIENPQANILFERYTFKLTNSCRYTPDFAVIHPVIFDDPTKRRIDFFEVKGKFLFRGATKSATHTSLTKPKLAAENYPWHRWFVAQKIDGEWKRKEYTAAE